MFMHLAAALLVQSQGGAPPATAQKPAPRRDTVALVAPDDSAHADSGRRGKSINIGVRLRRIEQRRAGPTPAQLASAYRNARTRELIRHALETRLGHDSSLTSYDAKVRQRMSVGMSFRETARSRLLFRAENAARVRWQRGVGVHVQVTGARSAIPIAFPGVRVIKDVAEAIPIPYFPGREGLLLYFGSNKVTDTDSALFVHPLDEGAEVFYTYALGDSVSFRLPGDRTIRLLEVRVRAREASPDLLVGSIWFDAESAQLVRAAFRPAVPLDITAFIEDEEENDPDGDDMPAALKATLSPMELDIAGVSIEYGLSDGRWWLPRLQTIEGKVRVGFIRTPFTMEEAFEYASVNGDLGLAPIVLTDTTETEIQARMDSVLQVEDSTLTPEERRRRIREERRTHRLALADSARTSERARRDSLKRAGVKPEDDEFSSAEYRCRAGDTAITRASRRFGNELAVAITVPCDTVVLLHSVDLPPSIFDPADEMFGKKEADELIGSLGLGTQAGWGAQKPTLHYGIERGLLRYNRVEGLAAGIAVDQSFGSGYSGEALLRVGLADLRPTAELNARRGNGRATLGVGVYRRLSVADDWGSPLGFGASLSSLLFARDEGFYYYTHGAELAGSWQRQSLIDWRVFIEGQRSANVETQFSLAHAMNGTRFIPNIDAASAEEAGAAARFRGSRGEDPLGLRLSADLRLEAALGDFDYSRGALDLTMSHGLGRKVMSSLSAGAGTTGGSVPPQRLWYLGGSQTIRGQRAGTAQGDAFWMTHLELGRGYPAARVVLFGDMGWTGSRRDWSRPGRPLSGVGIGASVLDGLVRFDLARGIAPREQWRTDLYVEARF